MKETVFFNGRFIAEDEARVSVLAPGFLYGWGLFETMRSCRNNIVYLQGHLERIKDSCKLMEMRFYYPLGKLKKIIQETVKINGFKDSYVRLTLWKSISGTGILVMAKKYQSYPPLKYRQGFYACISSYKQNENSLLSHLKTTSYLLYQLAYLEAKNKGYNEAIMLNQRGYITEGARSNIFLVKNREIFTPGLECGCLKGITRKVVFDFAKRYGIKIHEGNFTLQDLYQADEAFLTNSLMGVMPLAQVGKHRISKNTRGFKLAGFLMKKYFALLKNGT